MAISGSNITATEYNNFVGRVNAIMGIGLGTNGYGQAITASTVSSGSVTDITATQWANLRNDVNIAYRHQVGTDTGVGDIQAGNIIGADASNPGTTVGTGTSGLTDIDKGVNDFNTAIDLIEASPLDFDLAYAVTETKLVGSNISSPVYNSGLRYTANWQYVQGELDVTFVGGYTCKNNDGTDILATAEDHRRHFFNAGGAIIFDPSLDTDSPDSLKEQDWRDLLADCGNIFFDASNTTKTGTNGTSSSIGFWDLTTSYQLIFTAGGGGISGNYAENRFRINAKLVDSNIVRFRIDYDDLDTGDQTGIGSPQDENITADVYMDVSQRRASGAGEVTVPTPTYSMFANFDNIGALTGFT